MQFDRSGHPVPLGGAVTDPDGVKYGFAGIEGDHVVLHCWTPEETWTVRAAVGVPVESAGRRILVSRVLGESGSRPWIVLGATTS